MKRFRLFVSQQLGIADDIDEEHMRNLQARLRFLLIRHIKCDAITVRHMTEMKMVRN